MTSTSPTLHEQIDLFADVGDVGQPVDVGEVLDDRTERTRGSVLWAAYGDALGFISELVNEKGLRRRTNGAELDHLMAWTRRVGGRRGVDVEMPAGCWSDDTQLRVAVSRAISRHGFDVVSFARIELPVWPSYALGGGRASKAAAANLAKPNALWYANTFRGWVDAGGNGAAMRVQPHVWAASDLDGGGYMLDVITDSVCTHGHPRAIVGACFHAATLAHCMREGAVPDPGRCEEIAAGLDDTRSLIESHRYLGSTWVSLWEQETGQQFRVAWRVTVDELRAAIGQVGEAVDGAEGTAGIYGRVSDRLGLKDEAQRGSGVLTPVAAVALAEAASSAYEAVVVAANEIGTDTDTIATMAGALLGACDSSTEPPEKPVDNDYLLHEADRLVAIARGEEAANHSYPDILTWTAPRAQADALVEADAQLAVEGLGMVSEIAAELSWTSRKDFAWQWLKTDFGQTLLVKRRPEVRSLKAANDLVQPPVLMRKPPSRNRVESKENTPRGSAALPLDRGVDLTGALKHAREWITDDARLGYTVRRVARDGTSENLVALVEELRDDLRR